MLCNMSVGIPLNILQKIVLPYCHTPKKPSFKQIESLDLTRDMLGLHVKYAKTFLHLLVVYIGLTWFNQYQLLPELVPGPCSTGRSVVWPTGVPGRCASRHGVDPFVQRVEGKKNTPLIGEKTP